MTKAELQRLEAEIQQACDEGALSYPDGEQIIAALREKMQSERGHLEEIARLERLVSQRDEEAAEMREDWAKQYGLMPRAPEEIAEREAMALLLTAPKNCSCRVCNPTSRRMIVCYSCGNKRCPSAQSHRYICSGSNEPDQVPCLQQ